MKSKHAFILAFLITGLIASNTIIFQILNKPPLETTTITRVIDGDTFETLELTIRLTNINTPEKSRPGYEQAKSFLKQFENQTIQIQTQGVDKYGRTLARTFTPEYLNLEIVKEGLGTKFLVEKSELKLFSEAETLAINQEKGIWKKSEYFNCFKSTISPEKEIITLKNNCQEINLKDFTLTDESRKEFNLPSINLGQINIHTLKGENNETDIFLNQNQALWNNDRDTIYLFNQENHLVHYNPYGY